MNHIAVISGAKPTGLNRPWTSKELAQLRQLAFLGAETIAEELERSVRSVKRAAERHRISLRRSGERRGHVLGQPLRGAFVTDAAMARIHADVLDGRADPARIARRAEAFAQGADLCPSCTRNPIEVELTGLCTACHKRNLALAHASEADELEADRELDRERQRKHRRRVKKAS